MRHQTEQGVRMCGIKQNKGCICATSNRIRGACVRHQIVLIITQLDTKNTLTTRGTLMDEQVRLVGSRLGSVSSGLNT